MASILIVDDDAAMRDALGEAARDLGHDAHLAASGTEAIALLDAQAIDAMLLDLRMPGMDGIEVLRRVRARPRPLPVTVLTAHATAANTIEAMRLGAFDHLTKPIGREELSRVLVGMLAARAEPSAFRPQQEPGGLIGSSESMRTIQKTIGMLADSNATVLISGETGTGKELVARAIHDHGHRGGKPFIPVNCAAIPTELMESELFGHVRGAFTGAVSDRKGAFREAAHGTLFLDEIGDMDIAMQAKILRALQERVVTPVGGKPVPVDVRVIAATHRDLKQRVRDGSFREDLFYRLHVVPAHLPAAARAYRRHRSPCRILSRAIWWRQAARTRCCCAAHPPCLARKCPRVEERDRARRSARAGRYRQFGRSRLHRRESGSNRGSNRLAG